MVSSLKAAVALQTAKLFKDGFVIIDLETTGFDRDPTVEVVEVAILNHKGETLLNTLVKPIEMIPPDAYRIHGIDNDDVTDAESFPSFYPQMAVLLNGKTVVSYNYTFEENVLKHICRRHQLDPIKPSQWFCAMRKYQEYAGRYSFSKLGEACKREGVKVENTHRALGDCIMTLALLRKMAGV